MLWCRFSTASLISSSSGSEVLSVADLLDHFADASISVDLLQEIVSGDEARVPTFTRRVHLLLQGTTEDLRDLRAAHPTHGRQHRTVVDVGEERATRRRLRAPAGQLQDLLLARPIWERHLHQPIQAAGSHQRRVDGVGTDGGADDEEAREVLEPVELLTEGRPQSRRGLARLRGRKEMLQGERVSLIEENHAPALVLGHGEDLREQLARVRAELRGEVHEFQMIENGRRLRGQGAGEHGLARAGRPVEEHALRGPDPPLAVELGVGERGAEAPHDGLGLAQPADLREGGLGLHLYQTAPREVTIILPPLAEALLDAALNRPLLAVP